MNKARGFIDDVYDKKMNSFQKSSNLSNVLLSGYKLLICDEDV